MTNSFPALSPDEVSRRQRAYLAFVQTQADSGPDGAHDAGHLARVWRNCQRIAATEPGNADTEILLAASYLHDLVNLPKNSPDRARASQRSADRAVAFLQDMGFPPAKLDAVAHAIAAHSFSAGIVPRTPESAILQDADRLEALGAIGLARMFWVAGATGRALFDADDPMALGRPLDDTAFALDHVEVKLRRVATGMNTATGRDLAAEAMEWVEAFRSRLLRETG